MKMPTIPLLVVAAVVLLIIRKITFLPRASLRPNRTISWAIFLTCGACLVALYISLVFWSADDVRSDSEALSFYFATCAACLLIMQGVFHSCGVSLRDDAVERRNRAAAFVVAAQTVAVTFCVACSNVGNGPGPEAVAFCMLISNGTLVALWLMLDRMTRAIDTLTIERDDNAGWRIGAWFIATSAVIGASVAGDWISYEATLRDFARCAWPVVILLMVEVLAERYFALRSERKVHRVASAVLGAGELAAGVAYASWVLRA